MSRLTRLSGAGVVVAAAILIFLMLAQPKMPMREFYSVWEKELLQIPEMTGTWYNVSLHPSNKQNYRASCSITPLLDQIPMSLDLWVVNETGLSLLEEKRREGTTPAGYPPSPYALICGIENGSEREFELGNLDHDGYYYFYFVNHLVTQKVSASLSESWTELDPIIPSEPAYVTAASLLAVIGAYLLSRDLKSRKKTELASAR